MVPMSLSFGITIRVGHSLGKGLHDEARIQAICGILTAALIAVLSVLCIMIFRQQIIGLYTNDPLIVKGASVLLVCAAMYQISDAVQASASGALRGYKDTRVPMLLSCGAYWGVALPVGYAFAMTDIFGAPMGTEGFWVGIITGLTLAACLLIGRLIRVVRQQAI